MRLLPEIISGCFAERGSISLSSFVGSSPGHKQTETSPKTTPTAYPMAPRRARRHTFSAGPSRTRTAPMLRPRSDLGMAGVLSAPFSARASAKTKPTETRQKRLHPHLDRA